MANPVHNVTEANIKLAEEWGNKGGKFSALAIHLGIDVNTADRWYRDHWIKGKNDVAMSMAARYINLINQMYNKVTPDKNGVDKSSVDDKNLVANILDKFLAKRGGSEWSIKQQIEQTNINIDAGTSDYSKFSEEDKKAMDAIILKTMG